jgi:hypothetical protein
MLNSYGQVSYLSNNPQANPVSLGYFGWDENTNANHHFLSCKTTMSE